MMRYKPLLASALVATLFLLAACSPLPLVETQQEAAVTLPTPLPALAPLAPTGDSRSNEAARVQLMFLSADGTQLVPDTRTIWVNEGSTLVEQAMNTLLEPPRSEGLKAVAPGGTKLLSAELVNGICTVDLSSEASNQDAQSMAYMQTAFANTLTGLPGVAYVNVLIGGQAEGMGDQIIALPSGALRHTDNALPAIWLQAQTDESRVQAGAAQQQLERTAVLYFGAKHGELLVPEARQVRFEAKDLRTGPRNLIMPLLQQLWAGPSDTQDARAVFPKEMEKMKAVPTITTQSDGRRVINLLLWESFEADMAAAGLSLRQFYGALTLTLTQFVPEVDGLSVRVGNRRVTSLEVMGGEPLIFEAGVMVPTDFQAMIGDVARIYLADDLGKLVGCGRVMDPYAAQLPRALIEQLMLGPQADEGALRTVMPAGVSTEDVLGVKIEAGVALINLSSNFYRCAQALDEGQERAMIYAMVNTLTELSGVDKVRFYVEGKVEDVLAQKIYLGTELLRNPGLIVE